MHPLRIGAALLAVLMLGGGALALAGTGGDDHSKRGWGHKRSDNAFALLRNANGDVVGQVFFHQGWRDDKVTVFARVKDVPPGFHGFHIHTVGTCTPPDFTSAGGHFNPTGEHHPSHAGDLPSLLVNADGTATLAAVTDRFAIDDLRDADGSAVMIHSGPDNFANIPTRYAPNGPDQATLDTGDSGTRFACGEVR